MSFISGGVTNTQLSAQLAPIATSAQVTAAVAPLATTAQLATDVRIIKSIQTVSITLTTTAAAGLRTATGTITAVNTAKSFVSFTGFTNSSAPVPQGYIVSVALTNSTTVTASCRDSAALSGNDLTVLATVIEYQ